MSNLSFKGRDFAPLQDRLAETWTAKFASRKHRKYAKKEGIRQLRHFNSTMLRREVESIEPEVVEIIDQDDDTWIDDIVKYVQEKQSYLKGEDND